MRGEYSARTQAPARSTELPPRARRIQRRAQRISNTMGTTSACAENTRRRWPSSCVGRNYLRVRGEYTPGASDSEKYQELPPRVRRIPSRLDDVVPRPGTTSACAENTVLSSPKANCAWNYLRVRGEYAPQSVGLAGSGELPPRARRILFGTIISINGTGTTSACAENTTRHHHRQNLTRNYLRVRGEYPVFTNWSMSLPELPPRARRIPFELFDDAAHAGTTSACAENTSI